MISYMKKTKANEKPPKPTEVRLNKFIADSGLASRRKADEMIAAGEVRVNGKVVTEFGTKVNPTDNVSVGGDMIKSVSKRDIYILLNKPKDCITTTSDEFNRRTVMDIVKSRHRIYPVGRLDRNTTGVLLLTNDGELANRLTHPRYGIQRTYNVTLNKEINLDHAKAISHGIELEDGITSPCEVAVNPKDYTRVIITITEGKNREVRRIFETLGYDVKRLDRKFYAGLSNNGMKRGEYRHLTRNELLDLKKLVKLT
jgi:23S rRNA pseudouridine2605 synthase